MGFHELFLKRNYCIHRGVPAYNSFQKHKNKSLPEGYWVSERKKLKRSGSCGSLSSRVLVKSLFMYRAYVMKCSSERCCNLQRLYRVGGTWIKCEHGALAEWNWQRKLKYSEKNAKMLLCSPQIPHGLAWDRKRGQRPVTDHFGYGPASKIVLAHFLHE